ncbi:MULTISPECIES: antitoxin Xre/MbcA/ParS toxin-binding domain-containing protein [unclassified Sphingopyxis]|uniref:antitoxin Xre/MbcA/ParS toxin-binding domain-containing protein n=1 Tax=unclassified Sphingopyxis TaxID=2614943 RepID=UPI0012E351E3|nr:MULTISPECIES: antitoxin Xre/MbcA/ParS toxin-binding domain-containing protein [unclassified Sphingopyxis]
MSFEVLVAEYPGDGAWSQFAQAVGAADDKIPSVTYAVLGDRSLSWLEAPVPALDGKSPREVLNERPNGELIIRSLVMRIH